MANLGEITGIFIHPVKSLPGIPLGKCTMTSNGIAHPDNINVIDRCVYTFNIFDIVI